MKPSYILHLGLSEESQHLDVETKKVTPTFVDEDYKFEVYHDGGLAIDSYIFERSSDLEINERKHEELLTLSRVDVIKLRDFLNYALSQTSGANAQD